MPKTIEEINAKIKAGKAVVVNAEEVIGIVREKGIARSAVDIDVVTTGTFAPMCSSGIYFNIGHSKPRIKLEAARTYLNDVPAYSGFAAIDIMLGATALPESDPRNKIHPGDFNYGGGHVIEELVSGKDVCLSAATYGTDCYPRKKLETWINIRDLNDAVLYNFRNAYQNYNVAVNVSDKTIYTYLGILKPRMGNAVYCCAGQLSPLLNDPWYKTIGIGTRVFLGGGSGYIAWPGTQFNPSVPRTEAGIPKRGAATLSLIGDLKNMQPRWLRGVSMQGYGVSLSVGVGIPIPVLNEEILAHTAVTDDDIPATIIDYSRDYPQNLPDVLGEVTYAQLRSGRIRFNNRDIPTASLSSYSRALEIANILKEWMNQGAFLLSQPVTPLPGIESGLAFKPLNYRPVERNNSS
ncbi:MAG: homocysteine biosynthesis protein [Dehalococcoidaceae bacterium]|nr:homocysteine biosynthesis protein [Dehalococcoidaceae bacterium]